MKKIYIVKVNGCSIIDQEYTPVCAFASRREAERYIDNVDDCFEYIITEVDLYDGYLEYSMDNYR